MVPEETRSRTMSSSSMKHTLYLPWNMPAQSGIPSEQSNALETIIQLVKSLFHGGTNSDKGSAVADKHARRAASQLAAKFNNSSAVARDGRPCQSKVGRKVGTAVPISVRELGPHLTQCGLCRGISPYQVASCSIQPFSHNAPTLQTDRQTGQRSCIA